MEKHREGILAWFDSRISNGLIEGINSLVQAAKAKARGYRNSQTLKRITYLIAGNYPLETPESPNKIVAQVHGKAACMIVSHKYRFIFLRTEKTAGTSLSVALESLLDEDDLRTKMRRPPWAKLSPIHHGALMHHFPQYFGLHTHATASQVREVVGRKIFASYYKFAIERNPWDRQVSLYAHRQWKRGKPIDHFDRDMRSLIYRKTEYVRLNNWSIYAIGREIVADRVLRYERLAEETDELVTTLGFPGPVDMPRLRSYTTDRRHYSTYYSDSTRDLIARWYAKEIEALGYKFESEESAAQQASAAVLCR